MSDTKSPHHKPCEECERNESVDLERRRFIKISLKILGGLGTACAFFPFLSSLQPSRRTLAVNGPVSVDLSQLQPGQTLTVKWRGKPIWVVRRTQAMLEQLQKNNPELRDPNSRVPQQPSFAQNPWRSLHPEYLVLVGVCTHLGCVPRYHMQDNDHTQTSGFYCPCHGSRFDMAGRVYRHMPAPINLEVPPYRFVNAHTLIIGETL